MPNAQETDEVNVCRFMRDLIVNEAHKKALKKSKLIEWAGSFWRLTPKGYEILQRLEGAD